MESTKLHTMLVDLAEHMVSNLESDDFSDDINKYQRMLNHLSTYEYMEPPTDSDKQLLRKAQQLIDAKI